jgi:hypothetical protein
MSMGVYIRGMEMPRNSDECKLCAFIPVGDFGIFRKCMPLNAKAEIIIRRSDCPLIPVPPHGRLKEEEWLKKIISRAIEINASIEPRSEAVEQERRCLWWFEQQIGIAPTIIEAEEGET